MLLFRVAKTLCAISLLSPTGAFAQLGAPQYGAESPQAVVAGLQKPIESDDIVAAMPFISPAGRRDLAENAFGGLLVALSFYNPDEQLLGSKPPKAELDTQRKNYRTAVGVARQALKPHGLDGLVGQPPAAAMEPKAQATVKSALDKADAVAVVSAVMSTLERISVLLKMEKSNTRIVPFSFSTVTDYRVDGDRATAKGANETLEFEKVQGRWYIKTSLAGPK